MRGVFNRPRAAIPPARAPDGTRVYAIGDIHGREDLLDRLLRDVLADADSAPDGTRLVLVYVGDYIDRGLGSRNVLERMLKGVPEPFEVVHLLGNHEEAFLGFLEGLPMSFDWLKYGGLETLFSYDVDVPTSRWRPRSIDMAELRRQAAAAVPGAHVEFLRGCKLWHVEGDYIFVHAGLRPGVPLKRQETDDLLWIRDEFLDSDADHDGKVVVHGHTICERPEIRANRINIDTGAFASGRLTCLVLEGEGRRFLHT